MRTFHRVAYTIIFFTTAIVLAGCPGPRGQEIPDPDTQNGQSDLAVRDVVVTTSDGVEIAGTFAPAVGDTPAPACLLVHQLGRDRSTYDILQSRLSEIGIASLAIDMRGHGESTAGGTLNYSRFTPTEWADVVNDLNAGLEYLNTQEGIHSGHIGLVGASISANLAVLAAADAISAGIENAPKCLVLLSPGVSYHGIQPNPRASDLGHTPVLIVSAEDDRQSYPGSQSLSQAARNATLHSLEGSTHGTDMYSDDEETLDFLVDWIARQLNPGSASMDDGNTSTVGEDTEIDPQEENE